MNKYNGVDETKGESQERGEERRLEWRVGEWEGYSRVKLHN